MTGAFDGPGGVVIIPARIAAWLEDRTSAGDFRIDLRGTDRELTEALEALHIAALRWRVAAPGTTPRKTPEPAPALAVMSAGQAAEALGITSRAVRTACAQGRLTGTRNYRGEWVLRRDDVEHYRAARRKA